jgi:homospermidine synthase
MNEGLGYLALVAAAIIAAMTNPTKKDHLQAISDQNALVGGLVELGSAFGGVNYNNYVVASTLSIDGRKITLGLFRNVVILSDEDEK